MADPPKVALVGCGRAKGPSRAQAMHLYRGGLFRAAIDFATATHAGVYIVSAKHGLIDPERVIEPYEFSIEDMTATQRERWGDRIAHDLALLMNAPSAPTLLLGESYARWLRLPLEALAKGEGWIAPVEPLAGIAGFGPRIRRLRELLAEAGGLPT